MHIVFRQILAMIYRLNLVFLLSAFLGGCGGKEGANGPREWPAPTPYPFEIPAGFPQLEIPADNPLTVEGVDLGKRLFFDPILSADGTIACASCHVPEVSFADPERFSTGVAGSTARNAMPVLNAAWMPTLFWDGRVASLEDQALQPVEDPLEMGEKWPRVIKKLERHSEYPELFARAFGALPLSAALVTKAIAQFERTLISHNSRYDRVVAGLEEFTPREQYGFELFNNERGDCFHCHGGVLFTDNDFHNNGLDAVPADSGRAAISGLAADLGKFKSPSLRNVEYTAPYMHDGRFNSLEEVLDFYNSGIVRGATVDPLLNLVARDRRHNPLTQEEREALIAFLKTLSDEDFMRFTPP